MKADNTHGKTDPAKPVHQSDRKERAPSDGREKLPPVAVFDIGGTKTIVALVRGRDILAQRQFLSDNGDACRHFDRCIALLGPLCEEAAVDRASLAAVGVNMPGMVDFTRGVLLYAPFADWRNIAVRDHFVAQTGIKTVVVENDVNACAVGEYFYADDPCGNFCWLTVSTGCGGAVFADGQLVRGGGFCAGEIGHIKVEYDRPLRCPCGQDGCLEAHASGTAMGKLLAAAAASDTELARRCEQEGLDYSARSLCLLADRGQSAAMTIVEQCGVWLGRAIANTLNLVNPSRFYIGGGVAQSLPLFLPAIRRTIASCAVGPCAGAELLPTALGYTAAVYGAAAMAYTALGLSVR